jgi:pyruvate, water dikinase
MFSWLFKRKKPEPVDPEVMQIPTATTAERVREKYLSFRGLLTLNTECLEVIVGLQEDLTYVPPRRDIVETRVGQIFEKAGGIVAALDELTGFYHEKLYQALAQQQDEVERYIAVLQEFGGGRLAAWMYEIGVDDIEEAGGKAGTLGEVKRKLNLPVPNGYVLTTEAYRQFCGVPNWIKIRDAIHEIDPTDLEAIRESSSMLHEMVMDTPLSRALEVALTDRARALETQRFAVRSSAVGEGPEGGLRSLAGQFLSLINVPAEGVVDAYKQVIASRFNERALAYRLSTGLLEVDTPMAVLVLPVISAKASGIMYSRDPANPKSKELWITATTGFGVDIAAGGTPADLFVVSRSRRHQVTETHIAPKHDAMIAAPEGGLEHHELDQAASEAPSLQEEALKTLAGYGVKLENYFKCAQDIEWAIDQNDQVWILQSRPLAVVDQNRSRSRAKANAEPLASGGRTVYPGQTCGPTHIVEDVNHLGDPPDGAIVVLRRASPEIAQILPRIGGLVAEWGNVAGHAAALLREFKVPSVFLMEGALDKVRDSSSISLDSVLGAIYPGMLWERQTTDGVESVRQQTTAGDPISRNILTLNLLDPSSDEFRPSGCRSTHDVLRYCHEKSVEAMFTVNDIELDHGKHTAKDLKTTLPLNLSVLDLGGGLRLTEEDQREVTPEEVVSLPFRALWRGISHAEVSWKREMPASLSDLASVMASSLKPQYATRPLGRKSYLLAAEEYMNFNARVAYHFTLVDASLTDMASKNYIAFRFAGGGATAFRRNLRAIFVQEVLTKYNFLVDRRGDLVNAWLKKAPATETYDALDILGRLLACTSQLDMYMTSTKVMRWYVRQFLDGNYMFHRPDPEAPVTELPQ